MQTSDLKINDNLPAPVLCSSDDMAAAFLEQLQQLPDLRSSTRLSVDVIRDIAEDDPEHAKRIVNDILRSKEEYERRIGIFDRSQFCS